jgi:hypothetical protein
MIMKTYGYKKKDSLVFVAVIFFNPIVKRNQVLVAVLGFVQCI